MRRLVLLTIVLSACEEPLRPVTTERGTPMTMEQRVSCSYAGVCYSCEYHFRKGKFECGFGLNHSCDGHQMADVTIVVVKTTYTTGQVEFHNETIETKRKGECR